MKKLTCIAVMILTAATTATAATPDANKKSLISCGENSLEVSSTLSNGDPVTYLRFRDKENRAVFPQVVQYGVVVYLCKQGKVLLLDTSAHHVPGTSFLLSEDAHALMREEFGEIAGYGKSDDDKIFWVGSKSAERGKTEMSIVVFSHDGHRLLERSIHGRVTLQVHFDDMAYAIEVVPPRHP